MVMMADFFFFFTQLCLKIMFYFDSIIWMICLDWKMEKLFGDFIFE